MLSPGTGEITTPLLQPEEPRGQRPHAVRAWGGEGPASTERSGGFAPHRHLCFGPFIKTRSSSQSSSGAQERAEQRGQEGRFGSTVNCRSGSWRRVFKDQRRKAVKFILCGLKKQNKKVKCENKEMERSLREVYYETLFLLKWYH